MCTHAYAHTQAHPPPHTFVLVLVSPLPELATWPHSGGEPAEDTRLVAPLAGGIAA